MTITKRIQIARLTALANYLDTVPKEQFSYSDWWIDDDETTCGTVGCALGHASQMPMFQRLGLKVIDSELRYKGDDVFWYHNKCIREIFGESANFLFYPVSRSDAKDNPKARDTRTPRGGWGNAKPANVAARIRLFVEELKDTEGYW